jgi:hypothetical protein
MYMIKEGLKIAGGWGKGRGEWATEIYRESKPLGRCLLTMYCYEKCRNNINNNSSYLIVVN